MHPAPAAAIPDRARLATARRAILHVLGASCLFTVAAVLVKSLGTAIPTTEVVLFRSAFALLALLPLLRRHGVLAALRTSRPWLHMARSLAGFANMLTTFYGYAMLPLATVTALGFSMPLFLTPLSVPLLGERVGWQRLCAALVGFGGILVLLRPWRGADGAQALPLFVVTAGVVCWALAMICIRRLGRAGEPGVRIVLWFSLSSTAMGLALAAPVWVWPDAPQLLALIGIGLISGVAQILMTEGYSSGETTMLAPFEYGAILYSTCFGFIFWGEVPDAWVALGAAIVIGSGLYIWWREAAARVRVRSTSDCVQM